MVNTSVTGDKSNGRGSGNGASSYHDIGDEKYDDDGGNAYNDYTGSNDGGDDDKYNGISIPVHHGELPESISRVLC